MQSKVIDNHPDLVFIEFAMNDAHTRYQTGSPYMTLTLSGSNLDGMVKAIKTDNPKVEIVIQTMNVTWDAPIVPTPDPPALDPCLIDPLAPP